MRNNIAFFEKVSFEQFTKAHKGQDEAKIRELYDNLKLPKRGTAQSAGYDFFAAEDIKLAPGETITVASGIRARIKDGWFLGMFPRSGHGFKFRLQLDNTVGIIDSDYYFADNEGHIMVRLTNDSRSGKVAEIKAGTGFCQGIFIPYGLAEEDASNLKQRTGGFGSTDSK